MDDNRCYIAIDLKSFYASVECVLRGLDPTKHAQTKRYAWQCLHRSRHLASAEDHAFLRHGKPYRLPIDAAAQPYRDAVPAAMQTLLQPTRHWP